MKFMGKHLMMLLIAIAMPPAYFAIRKRYGVALVVLIIMVGLASFHAYGSLFAILLSVVSELVQIVSELLHPEPKAPQKPRPVINPKSDS